MHSAESQMLLDQLNEDPDNWDLRCQASEALLNEGRNGEATALLEAAPEPPEYETQILKIAELFSRNEPEKAVPFLYGYLEQRPAAPLVHLAMAEVAGKLNDAEGAKAYYKCAVDLNRSYRDPDFEKKYGIEIDDLPRPRVGPTMKVELHPSVIAAAKAREEAERKQIEEAMVAAASEAETPGPSSKIKAPKASEPAENPRPRKRPTGRTRKKINPAWWTIALPTAIGVFLVLWLIVFLVLTSMAG